MADPRYVNQIYVGAPMTTQQALNKQHQQFFDNHPCSYGWQVLRVHKQHGLPVYHLNGVELMRHPAEPCWLVQHLGECYRFELHISEITANLETIKLKIELELSKVEFSATVRKLAA